MYTCNTHSLDLVLIMSDSHSPMLWLPELTISLCLFRAQSIRSQILAGAALMYLLHRVIASRCSTTIRTAFDVPAPSSKLSRGGKLQQKVSMQRENNGILNEKALVQAERAMFSTGIILSLDPHLIHTNASISPNIHAPFSYVHLRQHMKNVIIRCPLLVSIDRPARRRVTTPTGPVYGTYACTSIRSPG